MNRRHAIWVIAGLLVVAPLCHSAEPPVMKSRPVNRSTPAPGKSQKVLQTSLETETPDADAMPALPPRKSPASSGSRPAGSEKIATGNSSWSTTLLSLTVVIALILSCAYALRKQIPLASKILPTEVIEVLGKRYIDPRNSIHLIRCGSRILIVAHSPQHGMQPLSEITDPVQIDELAGRCYQSRSNSATQKFSQLLGNQFKGTDASPHLPEDDETTAPAGEKNQQTWGSKPRTRGAMNA